MSASAGVGFQKDGLRSHLFLDNVFLPFKAISPRTKSPPSCPRWFHQRESANGTHAVRRVRARKELGPQCASARKRFSTS
jgi:hypothetical protein